MRVQIAQRRCEVPESVLERAREQVKKLNKFDTRAGSAEVVFSEEKHHKEMEVIVHIDGASPVVATGEGEDFRAALDQATDRAGRILRKQRSRHRDHQAPKLSEAVTE